MRPMVGLAAMAKHRRDKTNYLIQSVAHALDVLEEFKGEVPEYGVTELSRKLKLHKNNVFRLLATLEARGYVEQNKLTENYRLGIKILELGQSYIRQTGLVRQARPIMVELVREVDETCCLMVLRAGQAVCVDAVEAGQTVRVVAQVGVHLPAHATASGKVQLAFESDAEIERLVAAPLKAFTPRTITDADALRKELSRAARLGYAVEDEEFEEGVRCVSAPIRDYTGRVVGAITVSGPAARLAPERMSREISAKVVRAAIEVSGRLGFEIERTGTA